MKKLFFLALPLLAMALGACDDGGSQGPANKITIDGKTYTLVADAGSVSTNTQNALYSLEVISVQLKFILDDANNTNLNFWVRVSADEDTLLPAGTYKLGNGGGEYTLLPTFSLDHNIAGGSIKVAVKDDVYTITIDCTLDDDSTIKGVYKGAVSGAGFIEITPNDKLNL